MKTISSYVHGRTFETSFQQSMHLLHAGWRVSGWNNFAILFSLYVKDMLSSSHNVKLARYPDDPAVITTSCQPALLNYLSHVPAT